MKYNDAKSEIRDLLSKVKNRAHLTQDEINELRVDIVVARAQLLDSVFPEITSNRTSKELVMDDLEGREFARYFRMFLDATIKDNNGDDVTDAKGEPKKYTASVAESLARKALNKSGTAYYNAKKEFLQAKELESEIYQLFKAIDQISNALSTLKKN